MANPTTSEVSDKTAPKADAKATQATTTTPEPEKPTATTTPEPDAVDAKAERFRVLKAFTLDDGRTVMPDEEFSPSEVEKWPARRSKQMVDLKYLRPIG